LWSAERGGEDAERQMSQHGKFGEMKNPVGRAQENNDLVAVFLL